MKASPRGSVVTFGYTTKDDQGQVLDRSEVPISYFHGYGEIIPGSKRASEARNPAGTARFFG